MSANDYYQSAGGGGGGGGYQQPPQHQGGYQQHQQGFPGQPSYAQQVRDVLEYPRDGTAGDKYSCWPCHCQAIA